jgi:hypothetical protein
MSLGRFAHLMRDPDPTAATNLARKAWHDSNGRHLFVMLDDLPWHLKKQAEIIGDHVYGTRGEG